MKFLRTNLAAYFFAIALLLAFGNPVSAQTTSSPEAFDKKRVDITQKGMVALGSWAVVNMVGSGIAIGSAEGSTKRFYEMNIYWNAVNLGLAGLGYLGTRNYQPKQAPYAVLQEQHKVEKVLLVNAGLDVAYMAGGLYLRERAKNNTDRADQLKGFGESVILQGAFLFVYDVVMHQIHVGHRKKSRPMWDRLELSASLGSLRLRF